MYRVIRFVGIIICRILFRFEIKGKENLKQDTNFIVAGNHRSNWDPIFVAMNLGTNVAFFAKKELYVNPFTRFILNKSNAIKVDREKADIKAIKDVMRTLKNGNNLIFFPEGTRNVDGTAKAKDGIHLIAKRTGTNIVPCHIESSYKIFSKVKITFGEIIDVDEFEKLEGDFSENLMDRIASL